MTRTNRETAVAARPRYCPTRGRSASSATASRNPPTMLVRSRSNAVTWSTVDFLPGGRVDGGVVGERALLRQDRMQGYVSVTVGRTGSMREDLRMLTLDDPRLLDVLAPDAVAERLGGD